MELNFMRLLIDKKEANQEFALVTVISSDDIKSCTGEMMAVDKNGEMIGGDMGGGLLQEKITHTAQTCINRGLSRKILIGSEDGSMEVFINTFGIEEKLLIAGSGYFALNIYRIARTQGYTTTIFDHRAEMLTRERFPAAKALVLGDTAETLGSYEITENSSIVIATHNHEFDEAVLKAVITSPARYIGIIGNSRRVAKYFDNLRLLDYTDELINRIHAPIGLDLGGRKTAEIALAVMAEIQAVKYGHSGGYNKKKLDEGGFR